uniref:Uncharacterized protein n=2 Tax=Oryza meridionalis TaxID=40149 RepID=A0A0E0ENS6_9ORYZ
MLGLKLWCYFLLWEWEEKSKEEKMHFADPDTSSGRKEEKQFCFGAAEEIIILDELNIHLSCSSSSSIAGMFQLSSERMTMSYKSWMPIALRQWSIYELRVFRREALVWINLLNRFSAPLSRPTMPNSNACNCTSSHETLAFWNDLDIRDHLLGLQVEICFDRSSRADFRTEAVIPLAVVNRLTSLPSSSEVMLSLLHQADTPPSLLRASDTIPMVADGEEMPEHMLRSSSSILMRLRRWYEANYAETAGISTALLSHLLFDFMANAAADKIS